MSKTIDQRVVEMRFDNKQFESNVSNTMSTIEKLKQSLRFKGATDGFQNISTAANKVNMSGLGAAVDTVHAKFSALGVMGVTALANITNSAVNTGKKLVSALTIDPIKTGFQEYETQINAVQTILANTKSKGTTITDVNKALDTLNTYADKTIYNFTEMTRNIGTFTAAGVDLDTSVKSIQGIANLAAVSGSSSQQASTAMYQLSQALAAGKVSLMDWNSVVNAGMGGEVFQNALKRTAKAMGTDVDAIIEKYGSFRESLTQGEWLTTDVLTKTLEQFTMAAEKGTEQWDAYKKSLMEEGYTAAQAEEILEMANTATDAATKVKTFTQLWDTLKESVQSGWTQTWEILIGDFEEAKELLTTVSEVINEMIGKSAEARNELLQGWKDAGGRSDLLEGLKNVFNGLMDIATPIKEAFRDIFPPLTVKQLLNFTEGFKNLTASFEKFTSSHGDQIYSTFKGIFSVIKVGWNFVKQLAGGIAELVGHFAGLGGGVLGVTAAIGDWLSGVSDSIIKTDIFGKAVDGIVGFLSGAIDKLKEFGSAIKENFDIGGFFKSLWGIITTLGSEIGKIFTSISDGLSKAFGGGYADNLLDTGLFAGLVVMIKKFMNTFSDLAGDGNIFESIKDILDNVRGSLEAYQSNLKADTLGKIAAAIAILAASILILSSIDPGRLASSLTAITVLFGELMGSLSIFGKIGGPTLLGVAKAIPMMIGMSTAILILSGAMKALSSIDAAGIAKGLVAIGVLMVELSLFLNTAKFDGKIATAATGMLILSTAIVVLANAVKKFGGMNWGEIGKGLVAIGALLAELAIFTNLTGNAKHVIATGIAMTLLAASMKIFASAMQDFSGMKWGDLGRGLAGMAGALAAVTIAMKLMPTNAVSLGVGLIAVGAALKVMASALSDFGGMSWEEIARGLVALGGALAELTIALNLMNGTLAGSAALIIAAGALAIIAPVMKTLGEMTWGEIAKGLIALAGAFAIVGVAGMLLSPIIPAILGLAGAFALLGIAALGIGAALALTAIGLQGIAVGMVALAAAGTAGATAFVASLQIIILGIADLIPQIATKFAEAIAAFCVVIAESAPQIAESVLVLLTEVINAAAEYVPQIVDGLMNLLIRVLESLSVRLPELISVAVQVLMSFFQGVADALGGMDVASIFKAILGVGLLSGLMLALSAVVSLIPGAMAGVLGMGIVIAELALVLAAIGALAQIPGLSWLIEEGGNFLQKIGTAIGQFVGGIVGGVAEGATSTLPQVGTNLSQFMTNVQPFIDGAKSIDESVLTGVKTLAQVILALTGANIIESLTSWMTGGNSLAEFGAQLVPFGKSMMEYSQTVAGIDAAAITNSAAAAKALTQVAQAIPNEGGLASLFAGDNTLADFAKNLVPFGKGLKQYSEAVTGIDATSIASSAGAAKALAQVADAIPNEGGIVSWFTGDNSLSDFAAKLVPFGQQLKKYSEAVAGIDAGAIKSSVSAAKSLVKVADAIPNEGGLVSLFTGDNDPAGFAKKLVSFGKQLKKYSAAVVGVDAGAIKNSVSAVKQLKNMINSLSGIDTSGVDAFKNAISKLSKVSLDGVIKALGGSTPKFTTIGGDWIGALTKGMKAKQSSLTSTATSIVNALVKLFTSKKNTFQTLGTQLMTQLISGMSKQKSKAVSAVGSVISAAANKARAYYSSFYSAGSYLAIGFANGISASAFYARARAAAMAQAALNAARATLNINSPSRESRKLGVGFGEGFVYGIRDYMGNVRKTSSAMADTAINGFGNAIAKVSDMLSLDMDSEPTIRPVLDLSEVTAGAGTIDSMFRSLTPSVGVLANVGAVNTMMNRRNQNGVNADVVAAIEKLRGDVGNIGGDTYSIGNVTYDDSNNAIAEAIQTIVRYAKIERRV